MGERPAGYTTIKWIADHLAVDHKTIRRAIDRGELPAINIGRVKRIRWEDFEAYKKKCRHVPRKEKMDKLLGTPPA